MPQEQFGYSDFSVISSAGISSAMLSSNSPSAGVLLSAGLTGAPEHSAGLAARGNVSYVLAGIDPVVRESLSVKLAATGLIWPVGFS